MTLPTVAERLELVAKRRAYLERQLERLARCPGSADIHAEAASAEAAYTRAIRMLREAERRESNANANYDTCDGFPPSDADPETGIQYGEVA